MSLLSKIKGGNKPGYLERQTMTPEDLAVFQRILHDQSGIVLTDNKQALVESRVNQRLRALGMSSYSEYLQFLEKDRQGEELVHLIDVISTNVTKFFREPDHFEILDRKMAEWTARGQNRFRFWSAACSTGEEPYTMAMTLLPHVQEHGLDVKILASDISTRVLAHAQAGIFDADRLADVPEDLRQRHFRPQPGKEEAYAVSEELKRMIMFRRLNFTVMPYPIKGMFDVIFCRNAMIYFDRDLRARMVKEFARLLNPGGVLMIGHAETLIGMEKLYRTIKPSVYQRLNDGVDG